MSALPQPAPPIIDDAAARRDELADFLRTRRAALRPEDVGLPGGGRRRTPGLRREEVAQLAGLGTTWYTWLEQGRDVRASVQVLESLADALELTDAERAHLIVLGRGEAIEALSSPVEELPESIERMVRTGFGTTLACVLGRRWDFLAWNAAFAAVFGDPGARPPHERNQVWLTFCDPRRRGLFGDDWEVGARNCLAKFRADSARHIGDPQFAELIADLTAASPEFRMWWRRHEVMASGVGRKILRHPKVGKLVVEHAVFRLDEERDQRLILYTPTTECRTDEKLARLVAPVAA